MDGSPYSDALASSRLDMLDCLRLRGCPWGPGHLLYDLVREGTRWEQLQWLEDGRYPATDWELGVALARIPRGMAAVRRGWGTRRTLAAGKRVKRWRLGQR